MIQRYWQILDRRMEEQSSIPNLDGLNRILLLFGPQPVAVLNRYFAAGWKLGHVHHTSSGKTIGYTLEREGQNPILPSRMSVS